MRFLNVPVLFTIFAFTVVGCRGEDTGGQEAPQDAIHGPRDLSPEVAAPLDSGNVAYREGNYQQARDYYQRAAEAGPEVAAAWFGIYMAELAMGNADAADAAMARARELAPDVGLIHPEEGEQPLPPETLPRPDTAR